MPRIHSPFFGHRHRDQEMIQRYGICKTDNSIGVGVGIASVVEVEAEARRQVNARDRHKGRRASERATATREAAKKQWSSGTWRYVYATANMCSMREMRRCMLCICVCMHSRRAAASSSYVALQTPSWRRGYQTSRSVERRASSVGPEPYICDAICDIATHSDRSERKPLRVSGGSYAEGNASDERTGRAKTRGLTIPARSRRRRRRGIPVRIPTPHGARPREARRLVAILRRLRVRRLRAPPKQVLSVPLGHARHCTDRAFNALSAHQKQRKNTYMSSAPSLACGTRVRPSPSRTRGSAGSTRATAPGS